MSDDGRYIVMDSTADLDGNGPYGSSQVFLRDMAEERTTRVSVDEAGGGGPAPGSCEDGWVANDGSRVVFLCQGQGSHMDGDLAAVSGANNRWAYAADIAGDGSVSDIALLSIPEGASAPPASVSGFHTGPVYIAGDQPDTVLFSSDEAAMSPEIGASGEEHLYLRDLGSGTTELITRTASGPASRIRISA